MPTEEQKKIIRKWMWKMDYCKKHQIPPAQNWAWEEAEKAYQEHLNSQKRKS